MPWICPSACKWNFASHSLTRLTNPSAHADVASTPSVIISSNACTSTKLCAHNWIRDSLATTLAPLLSTAGYLLPLSKLDVEPLLHLPSDLHPNDRGSLVPNDRGSQAWPGRALPTSQKQAKFPGWVLQKAILPMEEPLRTSKICWCAPENIDLQISLRPTWQINKLLNKLSQILLCTIWTDKGLFDCRVLAQQGRGGATGSTTKWSFPLVTVQAVWLNALLKPVRS